VVQGCPGPEHSAGGAARFRLLPVEEVGSASWRSRPRSRQRRTPRGRSLVTSILISRRQLPSPSLSRAAQRSERHSLRLLEGQHARSPASGGIPQVARNRACSEQPAGGAPPSGRCPSSVRIQRDWRHRATSRQGETLRESPTCPNVYSWCGTAAAATRQTT
jgi:hypothetical protein